MACKDVGCVGGHGLLAPLRVLLPVLPGLHVAFLLLADVPEPGFLLLSSANSLQLGCLYHTLHAHILSLRANC